MFEYPTNLKDASDRLYSLLHAAKNLARNECPSDNRAYLCKHGEECEQECTRCWENYLDWVANGCKGHPWQYDVDRYKKQESLVV